MYNDENNLYHYTYRKNSTDPVQPPIMTPSAGSYREPWETAPEKKTSKKKNRTGAKIAALALSCALLGGAAGAGVLWAAGGGDGATIQVSSRVPVEINQVAVDGKTAHSDAEIYAANVNSVVSINTSANAGTNFFGQTVQTASAGSGFIISDDGYIVTNHHVVADATTVKVTLYNGETYDATLIGGDEDYDLAVIKINASDLQSVVLGDSAGLNVGDHVLAIGNPLGELTFSMSGGMVSSVNRAINVDGTPFNMIQTDASINPGNSGGPLFNQYGEVVGIVSAKYSQYSNTSVEGLGFAIPMNDVVAMVQDIMTNGYITNKPYLGITAMTMNEQLAAQFRYSIAKGVFVSSVEEGSAAAKAGLQMGDVVTKVGDKDITSMEDLTAAKKSYSAGETATFTLYRDGKTMTVELTFDSVPAEQQVQQPQESTQNEQTTPDSRNYGSSDDFFEYFFGNGTR